MYEIEMIPTYDKIVRFFVKYTRPDGTGYYAQCDLGTRKEAEAYIAKMEAYHARLANKTY